MMSDPWTARLSEYLDGELTDAERSALERHLDACPSCAATLAELSRVRERARGLPRHMPGTDLLVPSTPACSKPPGRPHR